MAPYRSGHPFIYSFIYRAQSRAGRRVLGHRASHVHVAPSSWKEGGYLLDTHTHICNETRWLGREGRYWKQITGKERQLGGETSPRKR